MNLKPTLLAPLLAAALFCAHGSASALTTADLLGSPAPARFTGRTIVLDQHTRYINVKHGEKVTLQSGAGMLTWYFDGIGPAFKLSAIFPAADHAADIVVYVEPENLA